MKLAILFASLLAMALNGCSWIPRAGPSTGEVLEQARAGGEIMFDVVEVDERVVSTLLSQPRESLAARFKKTAEPPEVKIAIGDTISVLIWESAAGGLFTAAPPAPGSRTGIEPLGPESQPPAGIVAPGELGRPREETARPRTNEQLRRIPPR